MKFIEPLLSEFYLYIILKSLSIIFFSKPKPKNFSIFRCIQLYKLCTRACNYRIIWQKYLKSVIYGHPRWLQVLKVTSFRSTPSVNVLIPFWLTWTCIPPDVSPNGFQFFPLFVSTRNTWHVPLHFFIISLYFEICEVVFDAREAKWGSRKKTNRFQFWKRNSINWKI